MAFLTWKKQKGRLKRIADEVARYKMRKTQGKLNAEEAEDTENAEIHTSKLYDVIRLINKPGNL